MVTYAVPVTEHNKALVRQFISSEAGREWMGENEEAYPEVDPTKATTEQLDNTLKIEKGWRLCMKRLRSSVQGSLETDFGVKFIDTVEN